MPTVTPGSVARYRLTVLFSSSSGRRRSTKKGKATGGETVAIAWATPEPSHPAAFSHLFFFFSPKQHIISLKQRSWKPRAALRAARGAGTSATPSHPRFQPRGCVPRCVATPGNKQGRRHLVIRACKTRGAHGKGPSVPPLPAQGKAGVGWVLSRCHPRAGCGFGDPHTHPSTPLLAESLGRGGVSRWGQPHGTHRSSGRRIW